MSSVVQNMMTAAATPDTPVPPVAKKVPHVHKYFDVETPDDYHWMKDMSKDKHPDIISNLEAENTYAKDVHLDPNSALITTIYDEFVSRIQEDDAEVPVFKDPYFYYKRTEKGKQYPIYARRRTSMTDSAEEVLLNQNELTFEYQSVGLYKVSPDHRTLAYSLDTTGDEIFTIYFKDLATGAIMERDTIRNASMEGEWTNDMKAFYYTVLDDIHRTDRVYKHVVGTDAAMDKLIFKEDDQKFAVDLEKTNSGQYILIGVGSSLTTEYYTLDANSADAELKLFHPRELRHKYFVDHQNDKFLILTDGGGKFLNFKLCATPLDKTGQDHWTDLLPYDPLTHLTGMTPFKTHVALYSRSEGLEQIKIIQSSGPDSAITPDSSSYTLEFEEDMYSLTPAGTSAQNYASSVLRFTYASMLTPPRVIGHDTTTRKHNILKETHVPNYDRTKYAMKRIYAPIPKDTVVKAPGDTPTPDKIPISLVYSKDSKQDGSQPCLLYGYGSYGISIDPNFNAKLFSFVDRGYVYAIAHIRGGGECGRAWYECGKFQHKRNTFTDFVAAADQLVKEKYTAHDRMAIEGRSAGGLLIGATLNLRPDVAAVAIAGVPFVDVVNTMMDDKIPLTINEYEEWGYILDRTFFDYISTYSPYENLKSVTRAFPDLLVKAGLNDPRVQYWEPQKWVAKLRALRREKAVAAAAAADDDESGKSGIDSEEGVIVFDCKMGSGHFGHSGRYAYLREVAADYAFVVDRISKSMQKKKEKKEEGQATRAVL
ncbi:hypothetical protein PhCBS80983_g04768 [Powellomyces hirtus]|uniref:Prolyl endopeptidase n=1 Tax=Powellomyces hirtus TaxID=109895 RepID=A0A507DY68_9FUNG|nr:hypothetical protein PhCBS80983_g04768 [Powellomyces hirtus]